MSERDNGGDAFPDLGFGSGMTLRDWFAGQAAAAALGGLMAARVTTAEGDAIPLAKAAYTLADAMLEARK